MLTLEQLQAIKEYIEYTQETLMWEYSTNIVSKEEMIADPERMPEVYQLVLNAIKQYD